MTREQIIKNLEYLIQFLPGKSIYAGETLTCAIAALRGPVPDPDTGDVGKHVQGCWYCNDDVMQVADSPNKPPINATYCGLCGRKLEVEG